MKRRSMLLAGLAALFVRPLKADRIKAKRCGEVVYDETGVIDQKYLDYWFRQLRRDCRSQCKVVRVSQRTCHEDYSITFDVKKVG